MNIVSVDPGLKGAIAFFRAGNLETIKDMPITNAKQAKGKTRKTYNEEKLCQIFSEEPYDWYIIEAQSLLPSDGKKAHAGLSEISGLIRGLLHGLGLGDRYILVRPQKWQKFFFGKSPGNTKKLSVEKAEQTWPERGFWRGEKGGLRDGRSDAALIGLYAIRSGIHNQGGK